MYDGIGPDSSPELIGARTIAVKYYVLGTQEFTDFDDLYHYIVTEEAEDA